MKGRRPTDWELFSGILPSGIQPCWIFENGAIFPNCACYYEEHSLWPRFKMDFLDGEANERS